MAMNHQISSNGYDRYHGSVKANELPSQKQSGHGNMHTELGKEGSKSRPQVHDGFSVNSKPVGGNNGHHQLSDKIGENDYKRSGIDKREDRQNFDGYNFSKHHLHRQDSGHFSYGNHQNGITGVFQGTTQTYQVTQITVTHSYVFSGTNLGSLEKSNEAHKNFLNAALNFIKNPNEQAYKSLNEAMINLMDPRFKPAVTGGAAKVDIRNVNGTTMARFTMEVTPAPVKTLEEAREDLKNAYSTRRDGEKGIADIRAEAYTNYIRALSEKYKKDGVISHTNNTPTTPVFKSSVIYITKVTQVNTASFHELRKPEFNDNFHGKLTFKNQHGFWNDYRQNNKSYVDMLKHDSKKSHIDKDFKTRKDIEAKHDYRHPGKGKAEKISHKHHNKAQTEKAS